MSPEVVGYLCMYDRSNFKHVVSLLPFQQVRGAGESPRIYEV